MAIAYQAGIPIITVSNFSGWAGELSNSFMDDRKRVKCIEATTPKEALEKAIESLKNTENI